MSREELQECLVRMVSGQWDANLESVKQGLFRLPQQQRYLLLMRAGGYSVEELEKAYRLKSLDRTMRRAEDALLSVLHYAARP